MTAPTIPFIAALMLFASQLTLIPDDVLQVQCDKDGCQGTFHDYKLKYVDDRVQAVLRDGRLTLSYSGVYPIYDNWTQLKQEFASAIDQHGRNRKLSCVKSLCVISAYRGRGCTTVRR